MAPDYPPYIDSDDEALGPRPVVMRDRCLLRGVDGAGCARCAQICPTAAVSFPEDFPVISRAECLGCGLCSEICPTETISSLTGGLSVLRNRVSATTAEFGVAYFACQQTEATEYSNAVIGVACLGMLPAEFWFSCLAEGEDIGVYLPVDICDECLFQRGEEEMMDAIERAESWSGRRVGLAMERDDLDFSVITSSTDVLDRRGLLSAVPDLFSNATRKVRIADTLSLFPQRARNAAKIMEASRRAKMERDERFAEAHETGLLRTRARVMTERRKLVADALAENPALASSAVLTVSTTDHELCTMCKNCITVCPFSARSIRAIRLFTDERYCIGCGKCGQVCPAGAIGLIETDASVLTGD